MFKNETLVSILSNIKINMQLVKGHMQEAKFSTKWNFHTERYFLFMVKLVLYIVNIKKKSFKERYNAVSLTNILHLFNFYWCNLHIEV